MKELKKFAWVKPNYPIINDCFIKRNSIISIQHGAKLLPFDGDERIVNVLFVKRT